MRFPLVLTLLLAACAGGGGTAPAPVLALFVGDTTVAGAADGTGGAARFNQPSGIATDRAGNVYVADGHNNTIRKITPAGVVTTLAGKAGNTGSTDGIGSAARFEYPTGIATDSAGNVYVTDYGNYTIRKITSAGVTTTLAGTAGARGSTDGTGPSARFAGPLDVAVDGAGNLYVTDAYDSHTIRKITPAGVVTTFAGKAFTAGSNDGAGAAARFDFPRGIAIDSAGNVYVADCANHTIRKITPAGVVSTFAGSASLEGNTDGAGAAARFTFPVDVAVDGAGNVYVTDENHTIRKITRGGVVSTVVGVPGQKGPGPDALPAGQKGFEPGALPARIGFPRGVAVSGTSLYLTLHEVHSVAVVRNRP